MQKGLSSQCALPGQLVLRHEVGGQARMVLVKLPSDALLAVAPSSH